MKQENFEPKINIGKPTQKQIEELREPTKEIGQETEIEQDIPEKRSAINKVIGEASGETKQKVGEVFAEKFEEQEFLEFKELEKVEIEKTPEEIEIINLVNKETNRLLEKHGLPKFDISADNVHLLKDKDFHKKFLGMKKKEFRKLKREGKEIAGGYNMFDQGVFISDKIRETGLEFAITNFHEFVHFKSFQVFKFLEAEEGVSKQRMGLAFVAKSGREHSRNLNEALTEELTKKFYENVLKKHPLFQKKIEEIENILKKEVDEKIKKNADDIYGIKTIIHRSLFNKKTMEQEYHGISYSKERKILNTLIEKLYSKNKDKFQDKEQVFDLFVKSAFTGKLSWGGLVNRTFGKGTFKKLAHLDANVEEMAKFVDAL